MVTLSLAMIVKNEACTLKRVLDAASQFCDEMVVVDTGSTDETVAIAQACGARVEHFAWCDDFAAARNCSFAACTSDWILWLDADDVLVPETIEIAKLIKAELLPKTESDIIRAPYEYCYGDDGKPTLIQGRERFARRSSNIRWIGAIHEVFDIRTANLTWNTCPEFIVQHRPVEAQLQRKQGRNLRIYEKTLDQDTCDTRDLFLYAGELRGAGREKEAIDVLLKYLKRWPKDEYDLFEEPYIARIDLAECMRRTEDYPSALRVIGDAIGYNGARAEAYAMAGLVHFAQQNYAAAFPSFLAAAACTPPSHGGVVYTSFYSAAIHDMIKESKRLIEASK